MLEETMKVLFVCLGNICRSPAAEGVLKKFIQNADLQGTLEVDSAGTGDWHVGEQADPRMRQAASERGFQLTSRGRQVNREDFQKFDLIIAMDSSNFQNLLPLQCDNDRAKLIQFRELMTTREIEGVPDPYYGGPDGFQQVLDILQEGCKELLNRMNSSLRG